MRSKTKLPSPTAPQATLLAAIEEDIEALMLRIDARLYRLHRLIETELATADATSGCEWSKRGTT